MVCRIFILYTEGEVATGGLRSIPYMLLPKSRASIDQAPGTIIANVPPRAARMSATDSSPVPVKAIHAGTTATSAPTQESISLPE
jgi:hypothetical protein